MSAKSYWETAYGKWVINLFLGAYRDIRGERPLKWLSKLVFWTGPIVYFIYFPLLVFTVGYWCVRWGIAKFIYFKTANERKQMDSQDDRVAQLEADCRNLKGELQTAKVELARLRELNTIGRLLNDLDQSTAPKPSISANE